MSVAPSSSGAASPGSALIGSSVATTTLRPSPDPSGDTDGASAPSSPSANAPDPRRTTWGDALLPAALGLWLWSVGAVDVDALDDWGLLHALPIAYFVALSLLVLSLAVLLTRRTLSTVRLTLHLVALVVVLHGTVPAVFPAPNYPWVYKHIGVTNFIIGRAVLDPSVDIYQNWPGFFALAGWFTRLAGVDSPLAYARWAPVYFNLLFCLELAFVLRWLALGRRERWLGIFLFTVGNWVGQDYFAPQALAFGLGLAVFGMVLAWLRTDTRPTARRLLDRLPWRPTDATPGQGEKPHPEPGVPTRFRPVALACLFTVFAAVVVAHQLSPFLVLAGVGLLVAGGMVRPRWVLAVMAALALGYLALHLEYLRSERHLAGSPFNPRDVFDALGNPFDNFRSSGFDSANPMPGRRLTALGAPALILGVWALAVVGAVRRLWTGRETLLLVLLAASPVFLALGQNYGGEATFRIYLFSLPWAAALAASALTPRSDIWSAGAVVRLGLVLAVAVTLFMAAFYGSVELYRVRPEAIQAGQYFYHHAPPGSVLGLMSPNVPARMAVNYDQFISGSTPPPLSTQEHLHNRILGEADLPDLKALYQQHVPRTTGRVFLLLSTDQETYVNVLGLMPEGVLGSLDLALARSADWRLFYRNSHAAIYQFVGGPAQDNTGARHVS